VLLDELAVLVALLVLLDLDAELEAQIVQPLELQPLPHELEETLPLDLQVGH
jgi:hypothetical protein